MQSIWTASAQAPEFPALDRSIEVDTVIVGGGITGLSTALRLAEAGQRVAVLEGRRLGALNTGGSTGNLYGTVSGGLHTLRRKWGDDVVRDVVRWRSEAVDWIESTIATHRIDCRFARRPLVRGVRAGDERQLGQLGDEFEAAAAAGLAPEWTTGTAQLPFEVAKAFRIDGQAQFNPYLYALGLVRLLAERGVALFEHSHVRDIDAGEGLARTDQGEARGRTLVLATHSPLGFNLVQAQMEAYREYGVSAVLDGTPAPEGIFWLSDDGTSIRSCHENGRDYLVVVGEKHLVGHDEGGRDFPEALRDYARDRFGVTRFVHAWGAEQFKPADSLPYIGRSAHANVLIATGFAADGLTWGTVASALLADLVQGRETPAAERLTPRRFTPLKSARVWAKENAHVMKHLAETLLGEADLDRMDALAPGEGAIVELDGRKRAVSRNDEGDYAILSPICTHMGCEVAWNGVERSWDCPCHGSRFGTDGSVIDGPAPRPLESFTVGVGSNRA